MKKKRLKYSKKHVNTAFSVYIEIYVASLSPSFEYTWKKENRGRVSKARCALTKLWTVLDEFSKSDSKIRL